MAVLFHFCGSVFASPPAVIGTPAPFQAPQAIKMLRGVPDVMQANSHSCGVGVVQAVMNYYGVWGYQDDFAKALGTSEAQGTHPVKMAAYMKRWGLDARVREGMTVADLRRYVDEGVLVAVDFQAWNGGVKPNYAKEWEDGHYCIVVGYSRGGFFLEDPTLLGTLGYLADADLERRWHDYEEEKGGRRPYVRMGVVVKGKSRLQPAVTPID